jgi:NitT/TauT family transport system ATP-binding protein
MTLVVEARNLRKVFSRRAGGEERVAVADLSFEVNSGEVVCVVGKTGCGKSTLVNMLLGLEVPSSGELTINGTSPSGQFKQLRRSVAAVFQTDRLLPWRRIIDNAALGLEAAGVAKERRRDEARVWLQRVGLESWANHYPHELSGGMRQRVAIARAFVLNPAVVLLDEAFGHLDEVTAQQIRHVCLRLIGETGKAALVITHNINEALDIASRLIVLGRPARVLAQYSLSESRRSPVWLSHRDELREEIFAIIDESGRIDG